MSEWKRVKLGEVCSRLSSGKNIKAEFVHASGRYPVYGGNGLRGFADTANFQGECAIIGRQGAYCGNVRFFSGTSYMTEHAVVACGNKESDSRFLAYYLSLQDLGRLSSQSAQPGLSVKALADEWIYIPPLPTQRKIAAVLGALDDKIENNRKICANLEAQAQALFKSWFVDFEPFGGKMPSGWRMGKLGEIAEVNPYRSLSKGIAATCVEMADLVTTGSFPSSWREKEYAGGMKFKNGDTIIARITPCFENGKASFVNFLKDGEVAFGSTEYVVMTSSSSAPKELLYFVAKDPGFISYAKSRMVGSSGRQRFSAEDIENFPIAIAPDDVYHKLSPILKSFMEQIRKNGLESLALAATRDALLPKLMSGEIDVEKVEV